MGRRKSTSVRNRKALLQALREMQTMLHEMNHKLDHLIKSYRKFYFTTDFSDSSNHGFKH